MQELFWTFFMIMFSAGVENFSVIFPNKSGWFLFYLCHNTRTNRCGAAGFWLNFVSLLIFNVICAIILICGRAIRADLEPRGGKKWQLSRNSPTCRSPSLGRCSWPSTPRGPVSSSRRTRGTSTIWRAASSAPSIPSGLTNLRAGGWSGNLTVSQFSWLTNTSPLGFTTR